jgi:hypothetical protein
MKLQMNANTISEASVLNNAWVNINGDCFNSTTTESIERRANIAMALAGGFCVALIAVSASYLMKKSLATGELNYYPVLIPAAFSGPGILFFLAFRRVQAWVRSETAKLENTPKSKFATYAVAGR